MDRNIILIGPSGTGKTTVSQLLGQQLKLPVLELDDLRWDYYAEIGYDREQAQRIRQQAGFAALAAHWKPYGIHAVERVIADYPAGHVIAFGAGASVYDDPARFGRAQAALAGHLVILLLPSPDIDESVQIMEQRLIAKEPELVEFFTGVIADFNRYFLTHPANSQLADVTIYTGGKTPQQTCAEIARRVQH